VFLGGLCQECELSFITSGVTIPAHAPVRVVTGKEVALQLRDNSSEMVADADSGTVEHCFTLPAVPAHSSYECHMTLTLPGVQVVHTEVQESSESTEQLPTANHVVRGREEGRGGGNGRGEEGMGGGGNGRGEEGRREWEGMGVGRREWEGGGKGRRKRGGKEGGGEGEGREEGMGGGGRRGGVLTNLYLLD
jgi:hypothetical protein